MLIDDQIQFIIQGGEVKRFHAIKTIQEETVGHHSFQVAMLVYLLLDKKDYHKHSDLIVAALTHDLAEHIVGDVPSNTKISLGLSKKFEEIEAAHLTHVCLKFDLTAEEERILALADILSGMIFCKREIALGSVLAAPIYRRYNSYLDKLRNFSDLELSVIEAIRSLQ